MPLGGNWYCTLVCARAEEKQSTEAQALIARNTLQPGAEAAISVTPSSSDKPLIRRAHFGGKCRYGQQESARREPGSSADTEETKRWFKKVIDSSQGVETFYTQCAKDRLQNMHR